MIALPTASLALLLVYRLYSILPHTGQHRDRRLNSKPGCTVAVFLGSGGHTSEALALISALDFKRYNRRAYIVASGDDLSVRKAVDLEARLSKTHDYTILSIPRARRVHQPLITIPISVAYSLLFCAYHLTLRPFLNFKTSKFADVLVLNGPGTCLMLCIVVYMNKFLGLQAPSIIYVETFARVKSLSLSGKLIRPFADRFITQWPTSQNSPQSSGENWLV
ncbi:hypothetical protein GALMADRAFT_248574 [Galerina marginata CBS 339.88]|uniref:UDP-N-acetylglucosamine transferase subunit ALG14 n=1 Tax=Galerina marginata (strain CBS 339.88) TaxID=685588 RepID=A0A067SY79_GALM3|nr:hypothetical protein GALMADRAFT_248574 [Galerina marginata CBS 339.88]